MAVLDTVKVAEAYVGDLQDQLGTVETVLEQVEHVAVEGEKAGRCLRRLFRLLLLVALVAAVIVAARKIFGCGSSADEVVIEETIIDEIVVDEDGNVTDETILDDVAVAVDGEAVEGTVVLEVAADEDEDA